MPGSAQVLTGVVFCIVACRKIEWFWKGFGGTNFYPHAEHTPIMLLV